MKLRTMIFGLVALCATVFMPVQSAHAQSDSALLDALVKKGVLSNREADDVRASEEKDYAMTGASKINLASSIKSITFYGDLRLRYEMRDGTTPAGFTGSGGARLQAGDSEDRNAWRYRLRFGVMGNLYDNFFYGFRMATNPNYDRSGNVTFGHSDAAGPFGKDQSLLAIDRVYLGWHANSDFTLTGGQMPNPLYTTSMIWAEDLNPAGAAEQWNHTFNNDLNVFATAGQYVYQAAAGNGFTNGLGSDSSFNNTFMYAEQAGFKYNFDKDTFFKAAVTFYTYSGTVGSTNSSGNQTVAGLYSTSPLALAAPNQSPSFFNGPFVGAGSAPLTNVSGINDLAVLEIPMEFDFTIGSDGFGSASKDPKDMKAEVGSPGWKVPMRIFSDFAYNVEADDRANAARQAILSAMASNFATSTSTGNSGVTLATTTTTSPTGKVSTSMSAANVATNNAMFASTPFQGVLNSGRGLLDQSAYQIGIEAGQLKKKGDWDGKLFWQSTGYYAVDPNLSDADIFNAATNMQGVVVAVSHNWTDGLSSTLRYAYADQVNDRLATPNVGQDLQLGIIQHYNLFQADLMWKF